MILPDGRTVLYSMWRSCERLNLTPPNVKEKFEENSPYIQAQLIMYNQIRDYEEQKCIERSSGLNIPS